MEQDAEVARRQIRNLYLAFMLAVGIYIFLGIEMRTVQVETQITMPGAWPWILRVVLGGLSVAGLAISGHLPVRGAPTASGRRQSGFSPRVQRCFSGAIIRLAFAEAIAIYGLLLTLLFGHLVDVVAFGAASITAMAAAFPTSDRWAGELGKPGSDFRP